MPTSCIASRAWAFFSTSFCISLSPRLRVKGIYLWVGNGFFHQPIFAFGEYLVFAAFAYHACNGIRLVLVELGFAVGKPMEPVYPYKTSLNVQRPLLVS